MVDAWLWLSASACPSQGWGLRPLLPSPQPPLRVLLPSLALLPVLLHRHWAPAAENQPFQTRFVSADPAGDTNMGNNWRRKMQSLFWEQPQFGSITVITHLMSCGDAAEAETQTSPLQPIVLLELCWKRRTRHPNLPSVSEAALNILFRGLVTKPLSFSLHVKSQNKFNFFTNTCAIEKKLFKSDYLQDHSMGHGTNFQQTLGPGQLKEQLRWVTALNCPQMQQGDMATSQGQW